MTSVSKGSNCSKLGKKYEIQVLNIVQNCIFTTSSDKPHETEDDIDSDRFNTQTEDDVGGSSIMTDIKCNWRNDKKIGVEIKHNTPPDWSQCVLSYNTELTKTENHSWHVSTSSRTKNSPEVKQIFNEIIGNIALFNGQIPPFLHTQLTYEEWKSTKKQTKDFNDYYVDIPNDTIQRLYRAKQCSYIQLSNQGLYHLGTDICNFNVPEFRCDQRLRIRIKVHSTKNKQGFCSLSVTAACQPKNIKLKKIVDLTSSVFSLDTLAKLPKCFKYLPK
jgi:hypothetical protein